MAVSKIYNWNAEKNHLLIQERGISFDRIVFEIDLLPTCRTKVMEQSPLISENSGYETIQIYR